VDELWFDELIDGKPILCSTIQLGIIESLLVYSLLPAEKLSEISSEMEQYNETEANKTILLLKENEYETDTRKQFDKMLQDGVFEGGDF